LWRRRTLSELVYADANVFIFLVIYGESGRGKGAAKILRKIEAGELSAYTSTLTWDEVVSVVRKTLGKADSEESGIKLIQFPTLRFIEVGESVIVRSQTLIERYRIKPRDAIHCSSAISKGISLVMSDDPDFDVVQEIRRTPLEKFA
jgi:predicted nucleic acid-binding protein